MKNFANIVNGLFLILIVVSFSCNTQMNEEEIDINNLLSENSIIELTSKYPEIKVFFVDEDNANVSIKYIDRHIRLEGIENEGSREEIANYIVQHLENPNKRIEDRTRKEAYNDLPPIEKMASLTRRIRQRYPDFEYKWVGLDEGNVGIEYGDNSLVINGIEDERNLTEIANAVTRIQKEIDKELKGG